MLFIIFYNTVSISYTIIESKIKRESRLSWEWKCGQLKGMYKIWLYL